MIEYETKKIVCDILTWLYYWHLIVVIHRHLDHFHFLYHPFKKKKIKKLKYELEISEKKIFTESEQDLQNYLRYYFLHHLP